MKFKVAKNNKSVSKRTDIIKDIQYKPFKSNQPFGGPGATTVEEFVWVQVDIFG